MYRIASLVVLIAGLSTAAWSETQQVPFEWADGFENGELNSWETYPFFQDMGFNPTLRTVTDPSYEGSRSLSQNFIPTDTDFPVDRNRIGVMKRGQLTISDKTHLSCAVFLNADRRAEKLDVILCSVEGEKWTTTLTSPPSNEWVVIERSPTEFRSGNKTLPAGTRIEAVVVLSQFGVVSADRSYSLNLDGFSLTGVRPNRFVGVEPESTWLEPFGKSILHRHYQPGETISLAVEIATVDESDPIRSVTVSILDGNGNTVAKADLAGEGTWSNESIYTLKEGDPPGRWRARLTGVTEGGKGIQNDLEFLVPVASVIRSHPRLLFTEEEAQKRADERSNPALQEVFEEACKVAKGRVNGATPGDYPEFNEVNDEYLGGGDFSPHWPDFMTWRKGLLSSVPARDGAFLYALAGDNEAGEAAKKLLLHVCNFSEWNHPWMIARGTHMYYPMGYTAYRAAVAFDLLYPLLSTEEKKQVIAGLYERGIHPCYLGEVVDNHIPSNISNHLGVSCTGGLLAAIALLGEDPDNPYMEPALSGILAKLEAHIQAGYLPDNSYAETFGYFHMDADMVSKAASALERNFGIDITTTTHIKDAWVYPHYVSTPSGEDCLDMGDGSGNWGRNGKTSLLWISQRLSDPMVWDRYLWATGPEMHQDFAMEFYDYLWRPMDLEPGSATSLPPSCLFEERGMAVFRSGWEANDLRLLYKAGPHTNHHHLDQGNFILQYGGETLLDEGGYAKYYENKYYHSFYTQAVAHNTVLLGDYPESQDLADLRDDVKALDDFPRIVACTTGEVVDALESELSNVYKGRLASFRRSLVAPGTEYLVLYDDIAAHQPETFDWLFHTRGKNSFVVDKSTARIVRPGAELRMEILEPKNLVHRIREHPHGDKSFVTFETPEKLERAQFLSVMIPSATADRETRKNWNVEEVSEMGWLGATVGHGDDTDFVYFRVEEDSREIGDFETDADRFLVTRGNDSTLKKLWLRNFTTFASNGSEGQSLRIQVETPTTLSIILENQTLSMESAPRDMKGLKISGVAMPTRVDLNGREVEFEYDTSSKAVTLLQ